MGDRREYSMGHNDIPVGHGVCRSAHFSRPTSIYIYMDVGREKCALRQTPWPTGISLCPIEYSRRSPMVCPNATLYQVHSEINGTFAGMQNYSEYAVHHYFHSTNNTVSVSLTD